MELEYSSVDTAFAPMRVPDLSQARYAGDADVPYAELDGADMLSFSTFSEFAGASAVPASHELSAPPVWRPSQASQPARQIGTLRPNQARQSWSDEARASLDGVAGAPAGAGYFVAKESLVPSAPRYDSSGLTSASGGNAPAGPYDAGSMYSEDSRVSCSDCRWVLEDRDWCCKHDCNDKSSPHYRQAYVCADPSDKTGRLTSRCEVETECSESGPPVMCNASRLAELQQFNSTNDPSCAVRAPDAPWATNAPWATDAAAAPWPTSAPGSTRAPEAPWATNAPWR